MRIELSKDILQEIVDSSKNISEVARRCGLNGRGNSYRTVKKLFAFYSINSSKFADKNPQALLRDIGFIKVERKIKTKHDESSLRENFFVSGDSLRRLLKKAGVQEICRECDVSEQYNDEPVTLEIDHINGNKYDNRKENLRFLCPNCHSQTDTFGSRNRFDYSSFEEQSILGQKREEKRIWPDVQCKLCNKTIPGHKGNPQYCSYECSNIGCRKTVLSPKEILEALERNEGNFLKTGKELGVSDNAVRKRLKKAGLLPTSK